MHARRWRFSPLPLVGLSLVLLLIPSGCSQKARLTLMAGWIPFHKLGNSAGDFSRNLFPAPESAELRRQNEFFRAQVVKLMNENDILQTRLEATSGMKQSVTDPGVRILHADVVLSADGSPWRKSLTIAMGARGGARKGMLVLYNNRLVGRILEAGPWTSRVQLLTDPGFRAGAVAVPRTYRAGVSFEQRHVGVYEGTAGEKGLLKWLTGETPVEAGAYVLTTEDPLNGVPRGLVIGRVASVAAGRGAYPRVEVEPALNFGGLEHVMLLAGPEERP